MLFEWPQSLFASTKIYILIFNLSYSLISLMGSFHFRKWKIFFLIHWQIFKILAFMSSLKYSHSLLCEFPMLFSRGNLKLWHKFSQLIHRFNIWILKCWSGLCIFPSFSQFIKEMGNWDFWKSVIAFPDFSQFT